MSVHETCMCIKHEVVQEIVVWTVFFAMSWLMVGGRLVSPQEDILVVGSDKNEVELYSATSGALLHSLKGHEKR